MPIDLNDDISNKMAALIQYHDKIENILKMANEKKNKAAIKELNNITKYQNALKGDIICILRLISNDCINIAIIQ